MALKFRRGTTAQQSGSLAFGEPYVNTTLGTLLIGGPNGDIVLSTTGTGSTGTFGAISGSGLDITGNANIAGNLTLGGNITIGNATTDNVVINADLSSSLIPNDDNAFDIGSTSKRYKNLYANNISASVVEIVSGSRAELRLINTGSGIGYHLQNTVDGNFSIHNSVTNSSIFRIDSGSINIAHIFGDLFVSGNISAGVSIISQGFTGSLSGSVNGIGSVSAYSSSVATRLTTLEVETSNLESFTSSINATIKSKLDADGVISGSSQILGGSGLVSGSSQVTLQSTTGFSSFDSALATISGSLIASASTAKTTNDTQDGRLTNIESFSGSTLTRLTALEVETSNLETTSASVNISVANLNTTSASLLQRVAANEAVSGTFARTNSTNIFSGDQTITGSLYVSSNLIVQGSSSIQNISSSTLNIGTSLITVNTLNPGTRFGGLAVIDSGSSPLTSGSILFDSINDQWIFVHQAVSGAATTSSVFLMGPQTYNSLGSEVYPTTNRVVKSINSEHIGDSNITDTGTLITLGSNAFVNGTFYATGTILVSGSSQITYSGLSGIPAGIVSGSSQITSILPAGVVSGSSQVVGSSITTNTITIGSTSTALGGTSTTLAGLTSVSSTGFTGALTGNASTATTLQTARTINGTSFNGSTDITIPNLVSGSSQISLSGFSTTNLSEGTNLYYTDARVKTKLNADGVVSGSAQINVASTTGDIALGTRTSGNYVASLVAGTNITLSNNTGEGATPTIGLTNNTISGISLGSNLATLTIGTGLSGTSYNGSTGVTIANTGVTSNVAGTGISLSGGTGAVTITNSGVTSLTAGTGVSVSGATGGVTVSIGQAVATSSSPTFAGLTINGAITATGDITAFFTSDKRHKNTIQNIPNALDKVSKLNGVTWEWNEDVNEVTKSTPKTGLIAQEVQEVLPEVVREREDGFLSLDYSKMVGLLVEAIKEQQSQIEELKSKLGYN
jgi:hypothetical protein